MRVAPPLLQVVQGCWGLQRQLGAAVRRLRCCTGVGLAGLPGGLGHRRPGCCLKHIHRGGRGGGGHRLGQAVLLLQRRQRLQRRRLRVWLLLEVGVGELLLLLLLCRRQEAMGLLLHRWLDGIGEWDFSLRPARELQDHVRHLRGWRGTRCRGSAGSRGAGSG